MAKSSLQGDSVKATPYYPIFFCYVQKDFLLSSLQLAPSNGFMGSQFAVDVLVLPTYFFADDNLLFCRVQVEEVQQLVREI